VPVPTGATAAVSVTTVDDDQLQSVTSDVMQTDHDETVLYYNDGVTA